MRETRREREQSAAFQIPRPGEYSEAISRVIRELGDIGASPGQIISLLKGGGELPRNNAAGEMPIELGLEIGIDLPTEPTEPAEQKRRLYTATQIARKLGIYSIYGRPHAHAVSAILNDNIFIGDAHKEERLLFETENVTVFYNLYDEYAAKSAAGWVESNSFPCEICSFFCTYHVLYRQ